MLPAPLVFSNNCNPEYMITFLYDPVHNIVLNIHLVNLVSLGYYRNYIHRHVFRRVDMVGTNHDKVLTQ